MPRLRAEETPLFSCSKQRILESSSEKRRAISPDESEGPVVDDDAFPLRKGLPADAADALFKILFLIVNGNDDGNLGLWRAGSGHGRAC